MSWKEPDHWHLPEWDSFYKGFRSRGELYSMTEKDFSIAEKYLSGFRGCLDIGAHVGTTAVRYAKSFKTVYAMEPLYVDFLEKNTSHLGNVVIYPFAASNVSGEARMTGWHGNSGFSLIETDLNKETRKKKSYSNHFGLVKCATVDSLGLQDLDFIKMDTEGFVLPVIEGMAETVSRCGRPLLQIEMGNLCLDSANCISLLSAMGYDQVDKFDVDFFFRAT